MKKRITVLCVIGVAVVVASLWVVRQGLTGANAVPEKVVQAHRAADFATPTVVPTPSSRERTEAEAPASVPPQPSVSSNAPTLAVAQAATSETKNRPPMGKQKPAPQDPLARVALSQVGANPEAEAYWVAAINDPSLAPNERKDLIEDLNEDGLSDPHHPGPQDGPLILSRLQLIEELAPFAMDRVNAAAFNEAYKDLANMLNGQSPD